MNTRIWVLGAPDPEMEMIERLLLECGESVAYALDERGERVHPGNAYRCPVPEVPEGSTVYAVECIDVLPEGWVRIDHHRPGDPGYGRPPSEFLSASSIGQVIATLARYSCPENTGGVAGEPEPYLCDVLLKWGTRGDFEPHIPGARYGLVMCARQCPGEYYAGPYGLAAIPGLLPADHTSAVHDGSYWVVSYGRGWLHIPKVILRAAASDHCLGAAYRGECPGVDPDALMRWRVETRAAHQGRSVEELLADVEAAREALREASLVSIGFDVDAPGCAHHRGYADPGCGDCDYEGGALLVRDLRGCAVCGGCGGATGADEGHGYDPSVPCHYGPFGVPELPEAAVREGVAYLATVQDRDGRRKVVLGGHTTPEAVRAFMSEWAPAQGLVDSYGDPARGFAGAYLPTEALAL